MNEAWISTTGGLKSSPTVTNGMVYVGSSDHKLYALDAATGTVKWSYSTISNTNSPAVVNGLVYVGDAYNLYCFSLDPGGVFSQKIPRPDPALLIPNNQLELTVEE